MRSPRCPRRSISCFVGLWLLAWPGASLAGEVRLQAGRLVFEDGQLRADGEVRLEAGPCRLDAIEVTLRPGEEILARYARLRLGTLELEAHRLRLSASGALEALWLRGTPCACPGVGRPLLRLGARSARVAPGGARLHLGWPALWVGSRRVLTVPYWALPLRPGVSGLLLPQLGYSERDGIRLEQGMYLAAGPADLLLGAGWIEERGASGRTRLRFGAERQGTRAQGELAAAGHTEGGRLRGTVRGAASVDLSSTLALAIAPDLVSDPGYPRELEREADRVFAPYARSRAWSWLGARALSLWGGADLIQDLLLPAERAQSVQGSLGATLGILPVRLLGPLYLEGRLAANRWIGTAEGELSSVPSLRRAELLAAPGLDLHAALGPLAVSGYGRYQLSHSWAEAAQPLSARTTHLGLAGIEAALPLARTFGPGSLPVRHRLEPFVSVAWLASSGHLTEVEIEEGGTASVGLRTGLLGRRAAGPLHQLARLELRLDFPLELPDEALHSALLATGELWLRPLAGLELSGLARGSPTRGELPQARADVCWRWRGVRVCGGYARLRLLRSEDVLGSGSAGWLADPRWLVRLGTGLEQVSGALSWSGGPFSLGVRLAGDPWQRRFTQGTYSARWDLGCGCYRLELAGVSRAGQRAPDLLLQLTVAGGEASGCEFGARQSGMLPSAN